MVEIYREIPIKKEDRNYLPMIKYVLLILTSLMLLQQ